MWSTEEYLKISQDWIKHRRYKKREKGQYWLPAEKFAEFFEELVLVKYKEDHQVICKQLESKDDSPFVLDLQLREPATISLSLVQEDKVCAPPGYRYATVRSFLQKLPKQPDQPAELELVRSTFHEPLKCTSVEVALTPGAYRFTADVDAQASEFGRLFVGTCDQERDCLLRQEAAGQGLLRLGGAQTAQRPACQPLHPAGREDAPRP